MQKQQFLHHYTYPENLLKAKFMVSVGNSLFLACS